MKISKKNIYFVIVALVSAAAGANVFAHSDQKDACTPLIDACKTAGYSHDVSGKDVWDDCVANLLDHKTVNSVTDGTALNVGNSQVSQCKQFKDDKEAWIKKWNKSHNV
jgi:accessory colonization factor AcfC